mgnify:FL=1
MSDYDSPENYRGGSEAFKRTDRVLLRQDKEYWAIYSLERLEEELIETVN